MTAQLPEHGLHEVHAAGLGRDADPPPVLDAIGDPWFESHGGLNEDLHLLRQGEGGWLPDLV